MARIPNGILGEFIGTAANVSGYMRMNTNFVRSKRRRTNMPVSDKRLAQQQKIKVCGEFTKPFAGSGFFDRTFPGTNGKTQTGYNAITSALLTKAITDNYPDTTLVWHEVLISKGGMPSPRQATASADTDGNTRFTWSNDIGTGSAKDTDIAVLVAYCPLTRQAIYLISNSNRADGQAVLNTQILQGNIAETWLGFISDDGRDAADSVYCGSIVL
jgi:hypothetical protein